MAPLTNFCVEGVMTKTRTAPIIMYFLTWISGSVLTARNGA